MIVDDELKSMLHPKLHKISRSAFAMNKKKHGLVEGMKWRVLCKLSSMSTRPQSTLADALSAEERE